MPKHLKTYGFLILVFFAFSCKKSKSSEVEANDKIQQVETPKKLMVNLYPVGGSKVRGSIVLKQNHGQVKLLMMASGLETEGTELYILDGANRDTVAIRDRDHWNPLAQNHGEHGGAAGFHNGDIGRFNVDVLGNGTLNFTSKHWCLDCNDPNRNIRGKPIVIVKRSPENQNAHKLLARGIIGELYNNK